MKNFDKEEEVASKYRLRKFARTAIANKGNVSDKALNLLSAACSDLAKKAAQSAFVYVEQEKRKTILERDAVRGIEAARNLFSPEVVEGLLLRLKKIKEEVEWNDNRRRVLFEADGRGRKASESQNAKLETP